MRVINEIKKRGNRGREDTSPGQILPSHLQSPPSQSPRLLQGPYSQSLPSQLHSPPSQSLPPSLSVPSQSLTSQLNSIPSQSVSYQRLRPSQWDSIPSQSLSSSQLQSPPSQELQSPPSQSLPLQQLQTPPSQLHSLPLQLQGLHSQRMPSSQLQSPPSQSLSQSLPSNSVFSESPTSKSIPLQVLSSPNPTYNSPSSPNAVTTLGETASLIRSSMNEFDLNTGGDMEMQSLEESGYISAEEAEKKPKSQETKVPCENCSELVKLLL